MNCLLVAFAFVLPYHVMRTAAAAGHRIHVLGNGPSRGLRWSRYCASYQQSAFDRDGDANDLIIDEIAQAVRAKGIDVVVPADEVATRLIAMLRDALPAPPSLVPEVATFDLLNDKWNFTRFCLDHGVRAPQGWLYRTGAELRAALAAGDLQLPITAKPTCGSGGIGVVHVRAPADLVLLDSIDYQPVLVQRHIVGETIGYNVVCRHGEILYQAAQRRDDGHFALFADPDLRCNVERLVAETGFTGPANFDAVVEDGTGLAYMVECNPRFWYTIYMSMIVGANFVDSAIRGSGAPPPRTAAVRLSRRYVLLRPDRATRDDWRMLHYHTADPLPYLLQRRRLFNDRDVAVRPEKMTRYEPRAWDRPFPVGSGGPMRTSGLAPEIAQR